MNAAVGIYGTHDEAVEAVIKLQQSGFPATNLTLIGLMETEKVDAERHVTPVNPLRPASLGVGTVVGATLGVLTGIGIFAIPGIGFLFGAGALAGAIAGFDFGIVGGGLATVLATLGVKHEIEHKYHDALVAGKFLVVAHGDEGKVHDAEKLLKEFDQHEEVAVH